MGRPLTVRKTHRRAFWRRMLTHSAISLGILGVSLLVGIWGYEYYEHLPWRDAFLNAAMLLGGMGPVKTDLSEPGKVFAGLYALYCRAGGDCRRRAAPGSRRASPDAPCALG